MIILYIKTDNPTAELHLYSDNVEIAAEVWEGHRQLAETIHTKLAGLLEKCQKNMQDIEKIAVYKGPGSFTGLRIGISVANTLAYSLGADVVGVTGKNWKNDGLEATAGDFWIQPEYGSEPHITKQKK